MNQDKMSYWQIYSAYTKQFHSWCPVQSKSRLKATKTPPWASLTLAFRTALNDSGKISEFLMSGVNQDSFLKMLSGFAKSIQPSYNLYRLTIHNQDS